MLHQKRDTKKYPPETGSGNDAFGARSETQRRRDIPRMARNRGISKAHSQITVKTGLAGWGGRIRTSASGIVPNWVYRYRAAQRVAADRARSDLSARHDSSKASAHKFLFEFSRPSHPVRNM
jgi:hypothetical protein